MPHRALSNAGHHACYPRFLAGYLQGCLVMHLQTLATVLSRLQRKMGFAMLALSPFNIGNLKAFLLR